MNGVLLLVCAGPMQSWGTRSRFQERDTEREPSKSGVVGLLCAALGRDRSEPVGDLAALRMGVRVDREGCLQKDFQTAQDVIVAAGKNWTDLVSSRSYLSDASFLVGLEGESAFLGKLHAALASPVWPLSLGRKSYIPSPAPYLKEGLCEGRDLRTCLMDYPLLIGDDEARKRLDRSASGHGDGRVRLVLESETPTHESRRDQPVSYRLGKREYRERFVLTEYVDLAAWSLEGGLKCTSLN